MTVGRWSALLPCAIFLAFFISVGVCGTKRHRSFHTKDSSSSGSSSIYSSELPENTPVARFFKYSFARLDEGDVKSLALVMRSAYANLCAELRGCERAAMELGDLFRRRFNELEINQGKMSKLGMLLQRLVAAGD